MPKMLPVLPHSAMGWNLGHARSGAKLKCESRIRNQVEVTTGAGRWQNNGAFVRDQSYLRAVQASPWDMSFHDLGACWTIKWKFR